MRSSCKDLSDQWGRAQPIVGVFPQGEDNPLWVLTRLTRTVKDQDEFQDDPVILTPDD